MPKKILVTGANGFVGKHVVRELHARDLQIIGIGHREKVADESIASLLKGYYQCDITNSKQLSQVPLQEIDAVINLAGLANVGASFDNPELYMRVNVDVLSVLGEALFKSNPNARMVAISTGALYDSNQIMPLDEGSPTIEDGSPYAQSKLAMEEIAKNFQEQGFDCVVARPFNHIGPEQGPGFLLPDLASKLKSADKTSPKITAGNLKTVRDYTDVRDIAKAYATLATSTTLSYSLYNVCSGIGHSGEDIIKALCECFGIDIDSLQIGVDQSLIRPTDPPKIIGDSSRLNNDTGWTPSISLQQTVVDIAGSMNK
jgi:GDP-4-dehydro-6-deoxy-D-mannose reductase